MSTDFPVYHLPDSVCVVQTAGRAELGSARHFYGSGAVWVL